MNITTKRPTPLASALACVGFLLVAGQCAAADYYLCAKPGTVTMPGGEVVPIWGYVKDDNDNLADGCPGNPDLQSTALTVPAADAGLTVHLRNDLSEPTSIVIPGQTAAMTPVWFEPASPGTTYAGSRPAGNTTARVRSFTHETAPGATADYTWGSIKPGTYLYHSGTHPQVQVQMGLYGAVTKNFADAGGTPAEAYDGDSYDAELTLLFSEIDPAQHAAIAAGTFGTAGAPATPCMDNNNPSAPRFIPMTSALCYKPKYYLINGKPFQASDPALATLPVGQDTLLRLLNAGLKSYVPTVQGTHMKMIAEDGNRYRYRDAGVDYPRDQYQYSTLLASLKTTDAIITPTTLDGTVIYDRRLHLVNNLAQDGGMFVRLSAVCGASCADLSISKSNGATFINSGEAVTYSIVASNPGPTAVTGAQVTDMLPAALTGATWTCVASGGAACAVASGSGNISTTVDLPVSGAATFTVSGIVDLAATGSMVNTASVAMPTGVTDPNLANNSATDSDPIRPTGSVLINGGAATTSSRLVSLTLNATGAAQMRFSQNGTNWSTWEANAPIRDFWLGVGPDGLRTVYVQFRSAAPALIMSAVYSDTILLDRAAPTGSVLINNGDATTALRAVVLNLSASDTASPVTSMRLRWGNQAWGAWLPYAATQGTTIPVGVNGTKTVSVQFRDAAGNVSTAVTDTIQLADLTPPTGSVLINGGAASTSTLAVTLDLSATDANSVTSMRVRWNGQSWGPWMPYSATRASTIPAGASGTKTVFVRFRDGGGNVSTVYTDTISYAP